MLSVMEVFVLPSSSREGLGIAIIEAMAAEKPVVATDIGSDCQDRRENIGSIEPSAQPGLYNGQVDPGPLKMVQSHCGDQFEKR